MLFVIGISSCFVFPCFGAGCHASNFKIATAAVRPRNDTETVGFPWKTYRFYCGKKTEAQSVIPTGLPSSGSFNLARGEAGKSPPDRKRPGRSAVKAVKQKHQHGQQEGNAAQQQPHQQAAVRPVVRGAVENGLRRLVGCLLYTSDAADE